MNERIKYRALGICILTLDLKGYIKHQQEKKKWAPKNGAGKIGYSNEENTKLDSYHA